MRPRRRRLLRGTLAVVVCLFLAPVAGAALGATLGGPTGSGLGPGTVTEPAASSTVISAQGWVVEGETNAKKPARLVSADPRARTDWTYGNTGDGTFWFYDVDPLPNGTLLVVAPTANGTLVYELDPDTHERIWSRRLPTEDTHDVDRLSDEEIIVADMRAWNATAGRSNDRLFVYNLTTNETTWEWRFRDHFPSGTDGGMSPDWTHVNDVDPLPGGRLLVSPRNFDQVLVVDRDTGRITRRLGQDDSHGRLNEQHNPDYLLSEEGTPTVLVADSENDRVVEYAFENGSWVRTWTLSGGLNWPRDADRLPNGNTLVTDSLNHRVVEVTPRGRVVWEYIVTWGPYDAERVAHGDGSHGPTMRDLGVSGRYAVTGGTELASGVRNDVPATVRRTFADTPLADPADAVATRWAHTVPWVRPVWLSSWEFASGVAAVLVALAWGGCELVVARRQVVAALRSCAAATMARLRRHGF